MIDTIVLTLEPKQFSISDHDRFSPSTAGLFQAPYYKLGHNSFLKCVQNPTSKELKNGIYKPRLTVTRRMSNEFGFIVTLRIEFSIPKLLFGNNFDEVSEGQFGQIIDRLYNSLYSMGVIVAPHVLREAPVSSVHYSKNMALTDYSTPYNILKELSKINLNQKLDLNQTDFRNEGHSLRFRANSYEISLYDKRKDLQKAKISEKRAIERDNAIQLELFDEFKPKRPFEVLRMEIRLNQRAKIRQVFKKINVNIEPLFSSIFKESISQQVLLIYLEEIKQGYRLLSYKPKQVSDFIADFKIYNPQIKMRKMLQMLAYKTVMDQLGIRGFREATKIYGSHNWNRLKADLLHYKLPEQAPCPISMIEESLKSFKPLELKEFSSNNT
jgi:hypothetical protein